MILRRLSTVRNLTNVSRAVFHIDIFNAGSTLDVCSTYLPREQCCSQANEDALGMTLNTALNSADLGNELRAMQGNVMALYSALTGRLCSLMLCCCYKVCLRIGEKLFLAQE